MYLHALVELPDNADCNPTWSCFSTAARGLSRGEIDTFSDRSSAPGMFYRLDCAYACSESILTLLTTMTLLHAGEGEGSGSIGVGKKVLGNRVI